MGAIFPEGFPKNVGDWQWRSNQCTCGPDHTSIHEGGHRYLYFVVEGSQELGGGPQLIGVPVKPTHPHGWDWDGNETSPTLSPSIKTTFKAQGPNNIWHGFFKNGKAEGAYEST